MKGGSALFVAFLGASLTRASLTLDKKNVPATLGVPFQYERAAGRNSLDRDDLQKREDVVNLRTSIESMVFFHANVTVGTPPQEMVVFFSLLGNECWMEAANGSSCGRFYRDGEKCGGYGGYNASASKTAKFVSSDFQVDDQGSDVTGDIFKDTLTIGNAKVGSMNLGASYDGLTTNTIGLGYGEKNTSLISMPQALADAGIIKSPAFSMWTEFGYDFGGMILFGGVNKAKYIDKLYSLPVVPAGPGRRKEFRVKMTGLSLNDTSLAPKAFSLDTTFDNQASLTHFPESVVSDLAKQLGVDEIPKSGQIPLPCPLERLSTNLTFEFGSAKFEFPLNAMVTKVSVEDSFTEDDENCYSGIIVNKYQKDQESIVLGTNFLNFMYSVFDLANDEVSLAHRQFDSASDDIVEIASGKNGVPGTTPVSTHEDGHKDKSGDESSAATFGPSIWCFGAVFAALNFLLG